MTRPSSLAAAALILCVTACGERGPRAKNLLIVCIDTLRADELGAYGRSPSITPALDRLCLHLVLPLDHRAVGRAEPARGLLPYPGRTLPGRRLRHVRDREPR